MFPATVLLKVSLRSWLFRLYFHELFLYRSRFAALLQGNKIGASTSPESNVQFSITEHGKTILHAGVAEAECLRNGERGKYSFLARGFRRASFSRGFQVVRNKALAGPEMGIQKVAAHETFAEFLRLYL